MNETLVAWAIFGSWQLSNLGVIVALIRLRRTLESKDWKGNG